MELHPDLGILYVGVQQPRVKSELKTVTNHHQSSIVMILYDTNTLLAPQPQQKTIVVI